MSVVCTDFDPIRGSRTDEKPYFDEDLIVKQLAQHLEECGVTPAEVLDYSANDWENRLEGIGVYGHPGITIKQECRIAALLFQAIARERNAEIEAERR